MKVFLGSLQVRLRRQLFVLKFRSVLRFVLADQGKPVCVEDRHKPSVYATRRAHMLLQLSGEPRLAPHFVDLLSLRIDESTPFDQ